LTTLCLSQIPNNLRTWGLRIFHKLRLSTFGVLPVLVGALSSLFRARAALQLENLALRHQIGVLQRSVKKRPRLTAADRILWAWLCGVWSDWRSALVIVKPETVIAWHRKGFRLFGTWKIRHGQVGRPAVPKEVRDLIQVADTRARSYLAGELPRSLQRRSDFCDAHPDADAICGNHSHKHV
jgi:hypothetical protein